MKSGTGSYYGLTITLQGQVNEKGYGVRLWIFRFGIIHKKVGPFKCGMLIAECGIQNTKSRMEQSACLQ
jgi:hypothetical protein